MKSAAATKPYLGSVSEDGQSCADRMLKATVCAGLSKRNADLALGAFRIAYEEQPMTLRSLFYRVVSAGLLPDTSKPNYDRLGRLVALLREKDRMPYEWIVDSMRSTAKPSSWSGLTDFGETVRSAYRKDLWSAQADYIHVICEKDAVAATILPITRGYDVALSPLRGYPSMSFLFSLWHVLQAVEKPIHIYYLGDFDPSGMDIERCCRKTLEEKAEITAWTRLAFNAEDFELDGVIPLAPKHRDRRCAAFSERYGDQCAEVEAIPPTILRERCEEAITGHINARQWEALRKVEAKERETFSNAMDTLGKPRIKKTRQEAHDKD